MFMLSCDRKVFATSAALVFTTVLCALIFDFSITLPFDLSVVNICLSVYLYRTSPVLQQLGQGGGGGGAGGLEMGTLRKVKYQ